MMRNTMILQRNCRSYLQNSPILLQKIQQLKPLFILLQEPRTISSISGYVTYSDLAITCKPSQPGDSATRTPGYSVILVKKGIACHQIKLPGLTSQHHETIVVRSRLPEGKQIIVASAYYRPKIGSACNSSFLWVTQLIHQYPNIPVIIGGDFNAKSTTMGYATTDIRGKLLEDVMEMNNLTLASDLSVTTRIGLHASQKDTTPDLTFASLGLLNAWKISDTTWGSDHFPITYFLRGKRLRTTKTLKLTNWMTFRDSLNQIPDLSTNFHTLVERIQNASRASNEEVT